MSNNKIPSKVDDDGADGCLSALLIADRKFYISTTWTDEDFSVSITDGISVWRGEGKTSNSQRCFHILKHFTDSLSLAKASCIYNLYIVPLRYGAFSKGNDDMKIRDVWFS